MGYRYFDAAAANTGSFAGRETVQLYYSAPQGKLVKPLRELGAYGKTCELHPGESESVTLDRDVTTAKLSHSGGDADFEDWMPEVERVIPAGLPTFSVNAAELESVGHFDRESV